MIVCSVCGHENADRSTFCDVCGNFLEWDGGSGKGTPEPATEQPDAQAGAQPSISPDRTQEAVSTVTPDVGRDDGRDDVGDVVGATLTFIADGAASVGRHGRDDLSRHLDRVRDRLQADDVAVVVLGEFKKGKSTLVNAVVNADVCPIDADIVTAVPTVVRYGEATSALVHWAGDADDVAAEPREIAFEDVVDIVSGTAPSDGTPRPRAVEVRLKRRILESGLSLIDTPGVGGLDSEHGQISLGTVPLAQAVLFVTDASQELSAPELAFLESAVQRCSAVLLVVTKRDLYPQWRRIVELDTEHLRRAGLDVQVVSVSSFLRLRAAVHNDKLLNEESGYPQVVEFLRHVVANGRAAAAQAAAGEVTFAVSQVAAQRDAERVVLTQPERAASVLERLGADQDQATRLAGRSARWQQVLNDGMADLVSDVEHDLRERFRTLLRSAESVVDRNDPRDNWQEFESWLRHQVAAQVVENYEVLSNRAADLAATVLDNFDAEARTKVLASIAAPVANLEGVSLEGVAVRPAKGGRVADALSAARGTSSGVVMVGVLAQLMHQVLAAGPLAVLAGALSLPVVTVVGAVLGLGLGRKTLRDEHKRQLELRRQQARAGVRKYLDDVLFAVSKDSKDSIRRTQRRLREDLTMRARTLQVSSQEAIASAERALQLGEQERKQRAKEVTADLRDLERLAQQAATVGAPANVLPA